jgi:hypothetical protein
VQIAQLMSVQVVVVATQIPVVVIAKRLTQAVQTVSTSEHVAQLGIVVQVIAFGVQMPRVVRTELG